MARGGRPKGEYTSELYTFRLSTKHHSDIKRVFDSLLAQSQADTRSQQIIEVITLLVRQYANMPVDTPMDNRLDMIMDDVREQLRQELREFVLSLITDETRFAAVSTARDTYQGGGVEIDADILDNILEDFAGRQEG